MNSPARTRMRPQALVGVLSLVAACASTPQAGVSPPPPDAGQPTDSLLQFVRTADSIALERTPCYGVCPAYRVVLTHTGRIRFERRNEHAMPLAPRDSVPPDDVSAVLTQMVLIGFTKLPDRITHGSAACGPWMTDHPSVTIALYAPRVAKVVSDDYGCSWSPQGLRSLQAEIDRLVGLTPVPGMEP